ncbi:hypothetical protein IQ264_20335 [Phormidium sp. LEGE 05292]|uniref:hypothetical protein n=1 Tax=[Phormidium] sp. LEGE 05292 TaxID=767427 RepID=UPI00187E747B|nr:hypothetical protein [Phormidium sp. LEGE 05292]MBE9227777.1 hypothetical protein [Phormidium sp. LEGE 05292]
MPPVSAEVVARTQGRCKLTDENSEYPRFNGHCVVKQKQQGATTIFVVELDDGTKYRFFSNWRERRTGNCVAIRTTSGLNLLIRSL